MIQTAGQSSKQLEKENDLLKLQVEKLQIMLEKEQIQRKGIQKSYDELWDRHDREMNCYSETITYLRQKDQISQQPHSFAGEFTGSKLKHDRDNIIKENAYHLETLK